MPSFTYALYSVTALTGLILPTEGDRSDCVCVCVRRVQESAMFQAFLDKLHKAREEAEKKRQEVSPYPFPAHIHACTHSHVVVLYCRDAADFVLMFLPACSCSRVCARIDSFPMYVV